jgi:hypothetical protein
MGSFQAVLTGCLLPVQMCTDNSDLICLLDLILPLVVDDNIELATTLFYLPPGVLSTISSEIFAQVLNIYYI